MSTQPPRNAKRARQKEGQQRRREAELAAMKRQKRSSQIKRSVIVAAVLLASLFIVQKLTGGSGKKTAVSAAGSTTTTTAAAASGPKTTCPASGFDPALAKKPTIDVPKQPATALGKDDLVVGTGEVVPEGATIQARYVGVDQATGKEFDSSWKRGCDPSEFSLTQVIPGWTQGIPGMKVGGRRLLTIPGDLGYGAAGQSAAGIGPNDTLVFVVDVVAISPATTTTTAAP